MMQIDSTGSRRKQLKPAKLPDTDRSRAVSPPCDASDKLLPIAKGTVFGPFRIRTSTTSSDSTDMLLTVRDVRGHKHEWSFIDDECYSWMQQLTIVDEKNRSNSSLILEDNIVHLIVNKSVKSMNDLIASYSPPSRSTTTDNRTVKTTTTKKFICDRCGTASFSSVENLAAHQTFYCKSTAESSGENITKKAADSSATTVTTLSQPPSQVEEQRLSPSPVCSTTTPSNLKLARTAAHISTPLIATRSNRNAPISRHYRTPCPESTDDHPIQLKTTLRNGSLPPPSTTTVAALPSTTTTTASSSLTSMFTAVPYPNTILLPVAYHTRTDAPLVQLLGQPQTIIPIAIARPPSSANGFQPQPLILEQSLTIGVQLPPHLSIGVGAGGWPFALPLAVRPDQQPPPPPSHVPDAVSSRPSSSSSSPLERKRRSTVDTKPLDLSTNHRRRDSPEVPLRQHHPATDDADKPYLCECGVSFSNVTTLNGHKKYYCKANGAPPPAPPTTTTADGGQTSVDSLPSSGRRATLKCQYCEYSSANTTQLSQHLRTVHSAIQGFLCQLCGYKGYSVRGMKSHMRSHTELITANGNVDSLIISYVTTLTIDAGATTRVPSSNGNGIISADDRTTDVDEITNGDDRKRAKCNDDDQDESMKKHVSTSIVCQQCQVTFSSIDQYDRHSCVKVGKSTIDDCEKDKCCSLCQYSSPYAGNLRRHLQVIHKLTDT